MSPSSSVIRPVCFAVALSVLREGLARGGAQAALGPRDRSQALLRAGPASGSGASGQRFQGFLKDPFPLLKKNCHSLFLYPSL